MKKLRITYRDTPFGCLDTKYSDSLYRRSPRDQLIREKKNIKHDRKDNKLVKFGYFEKRLSLHRYSYLGTITW